MSEERKGGRLWGAASSAPREAQTKPQGTDADETPVFPADRSYVAFELRNNAERLQIVSGINPARHPAYHSLIDIIEDVFDQRAFALIYSHMIVEVKGSNLAPIVHAISAGNCKRIREFHAKFYDKPKSGTTEPLISSIELTVREEPDTP